MNIAILSAEYISNKNNVIDFLLEIDGLKVPYTYLVDTKDTSEIISFIKDKLSKKAVDIKPYNGPSDREILIGSIRGKRNHLLEKSDFFVSVPDYPITEAQRNEIKEYRQRLRDITTQPGFPDNVKWPKIPDCIKDQLAL